MSELAEGARLEIVCAVKSGTEGSNPSLSASTKRNTEGVSNTLWRFCNRIKKARPFRFEGAN